jgi:biopolymer transport protein ExbD
MARRKLQEINAGSMADIAFLLLIFFLVTTTMDTDEGMMRQLPPPPENEDIKEEVKKKERNVFVVLINREDELAVEGNLTNIHELCEMTKEFFKNPLDKENLSSKKKKTIPGFGEVMVSEGVVSLQNDRTTSYSQYMLVQNELVRAVSELREELAMERFGKAMEDLTESQQEAVKDYYPLAISEAEPRAIK